MTKTGKRCTIRLTELEELVVSLSIPGSARHSHWQCDGVQISDLGNAIHAQAVSASALVTADAGAGTDDRLWRKSRQFRPQRTGSELRSAESCRARCARTVTTVPRCACDSSRPCSLWNRGSTPLCSTTGRSVELGCIGSRFALRINLKDS